MTVGEQLVIAAALGMIAGYILYVELSVVLFRHGELARVLT